MNSIWINIKNGDFYVKVGYVKDANNDRDTSRGNDVLYQKLTGHRDLFYRRSFTEFHEKFCRYEPDEKGQE